MKICSKCNSQHDDTKIYCPNCGNFLAAPSVYPTGKTTKKSIVLPVLLVFSIGLNIFLGLSANEYSNNYDRMYDNYFEILAPYLFYDRYARIVPDDGSGLYHIYECEDFEEGECTFFIYNVSRAKLEASPCQRCCADD